MNLLNFTGLETGDFSECTASGGTVSVQTSTIRTGTYAARVNPTTTGFGYFAFGQHDATGLLGSFNEATSYTRFYFRYTTKPATAEEYIFQCDGTTVNKVFVTLQSNGTLRVYDTSLTLVATGTKVLSANTWYRIEIRLGTGASTLFQILIDGVIDVSVSGNFASENLVSMYFGKINDFNSNTVDYFYDDIAVSNVGWIGTGEVRALKPTGTGDAVDWTGTYTDVDEVPHDSDTTFINSSTNTAGETVNVQDSSTIGVTTDTISAVKSLAILRRTGLATNVQVGIRVGGSNNLTTGNDVDTVYALSAKVHNTTPVGAGWNRTTLDDLQVGVVHNQAEVREARATLLVGMVDSATITTGTISITITGTLSVGSKPIFIGQTTASSPGQLSIGTKNINIGQTTLNGAATLSTEADNILIGQVGYAGTVTLTCKAEPTYDVKSLLNCITSLNASSNSDAAGFVNLQGIFTLNVIATSTIEINCSAIVTTNFKANADFVIQKTLSATTSVDCETTPIKTGSVNLSCSTSLNVNGQKIADGIILSNVATSLNTNNQSTLTGQAILNNIATLISQGRHDTTGKLSSQIIGSLSVIANKFTDCSVGLNQSTILVVKSLPIKGGAVVLSGVGSLVSQYSSSLNGQVSLTAIATLITAHAPDIGVFNYVENTVYVLTRHVVTVNLSGKRAS